MTVYDHDDPIARSLGIDPSTGIVNLDPVALRASAITSKPLAWVWPGWMRHQNRLL